jgi:hypothetical protein
LRDSPAEQGADLSVSAEVQALQACAARARARLGDLDGALAGFQEILQNTAPCDLSHPIHAPCRNLAIRLSWTADVYGALDRPNLGQQDKAAPLYERAAAIMESLAGVDSKDGQTRFDLAARYGKLADAVWQSVPVRALGLYENAMTMAASLVSKDQTLQLQEA